jgi:hypothetical protein
MGVAAAFMVRGSFFAEFLVLGRAVKRAARVNRLAARQVDPALGTLHHVLDGGLARRRGRCVERTLVGAKQRPHHKTNRNQQQNLDHANLPKTVRSLAYIAQQSQGLQATTRFRQGNAIRGKPAGLIQRGVLPDPGFQPPIGMAIQPGLSWVPTKMSGFFTNQNNKKCRTSILKRISIAINRMR